MTILDALFARHSVRQYMDQPLDPICAAQLQHDIELYNRSHDLHIQLVTNEPEAFSSFLSRRMGFEGVSNYIALVGKRRTDLDECVGYAGEKLVLKAQALGLNTCWVGGTYSKKKARVQIAPGERLVCVIAVGYGRTPGISHKRKPLSSFYRAAEPVPRWFLRGVQAAVLAPTAMNRQNFRFILDERAVKLISTGLFCSKIDRGILKYHFEIGAGTDNFHWYS